MKAFTLIELMVVLGITGVMLALGTWGLVGLQRSILAQGAADGLITTFKETQTNAKNDAFDLNQNVSLYLNDIFAFKISFDGLGGATRSTCYKLATDSAWTCPPALAVNIKDPQYTQVNYSATCKSILFIDLTGDIRIDVSDNAGLNDSAFADVPCTVTLQHQADANAKKTITIDGQNNNFKIN